ncbi:hypothetical protein [Aquimarina sp. 2304DJ70-9]|uniref:hypothetical protein n=1 Tax=Aquimarina penaris TaxID=3231044 RepID=UPI0034617B6A
MIPYEFILDLIYSLPVRTKRMFGNVAIYYGEKIILATRQKDDNPIDNGIWIATKIEHHEALKSMFPSFRNLETYKIKTWLLLPEDADDFEESAEKIVELIKSNSPLIGNIPPVRKSRGK